MFDSFFKTFILKDNKENPMKSELDFAVEDLKYNYSIYLTKLIKKYLSLEAYQELAYQFYSMQDRCERKNIFNLESNDRLKFNSLCIRMRNRKFIWDDSR